GEVTDKESQKVVAKLGRVATGRMDRPVDDVVIESIDITE
ncbi:MAG: peptidylprolyl isomerase, partial [Corynebacterium variabile]